MKFIIHTFICRSASILCNGGENSHLKLRAKTVCELCLHKEFYLTTDKVSALQTEDGGKQLGKNAIVTCSQNYAG